MIKSSRYLLGLVVLLIFILGSFLEIHAQISQIQQNGSFEGTLPSYWMKGKATGGTLDWATDQFRSKNHSLKITKAATTTDSVYWISENMNDLWAPKLLKDIDLKLGAFVMTQNVNVSPGTDSTKMWWISYLFYDSTGAKIGEIKLPIDQTKASSTGWVADTNAAGSSILPRDAWKVIIMFVAGKNATGTVWADDFILTNRGKDYAGQDWNTSVEMPTGWNYWLPPNGGNDALLNAGYENTRLTNKYAHSGTYSLMFDSLSGTHDAWVGTKRVQLDTNIKAGDWLMMSVWIKANHLFPDSAAANPGTWSVGFTPIFHSGWKNNDKYDEIGSKDLVFTFPTGKQDTAFDWTQYSVDYPVPNDPKVKAFSVRIHVYSRFQGTIFFDDLTVQTTTATAVYGGNVALKSFSLDQNYPNPFNPTTTIRYRIPERAAVKLRIYDMLGREVKTLVNAEQNPGQYEAIWNGENNYGTKVASGIYIYRVEAGKFVQVKKMVLLK